MIVMVTTTIIANSENV